MKKIKWCIILLILSDVLFISYYVNDKYKEKKEQERYEKEYKISREKWRYLFDYFDAAGWYLGIDSDGKLFFYETNTDELETRLAYYKKKTKVNISTDEYVEYLHYLEETDEMPDNELMADFVHFVVYRGITRGVCDDYRDFRYDKRKGNQ